MSLVDESILEVLTRVPFPKGFRSAEFVSTMIIEGTKYPVYEADAVIFGSGAAGLRAAVELKRRGKNVLVATAGLYMGTSACSGSDKQTLFTVATSGKGDNFLKLANAIGSGGCMDHDTAYVEAVGSIHTLAGLQYLGLELPEDKFGAILRYQTDHDEAGRATSCGPRTSRLMVKVLLDELIQLNIPLLSGATALRLLRLNDEEGTERCSGAVVSTGSRSHNPYGLAIIKAPNVVLATGGPGEMYRDSVYPKKCFGSLGLALEEGLGLANITESQFGIGTPRTAFPWNLSGTYVQVIPYIYSLDPEGNEHNFLAEYYRTTQELASNVFRKGYQWPFHATRTLNFGSSLVDMAIAREQQKGRKIYMDFLRNPEAVPGDLPFGLNRLDQDVYDYLKNNNALAELPIERLRLMNPLSISLYKMHGNDLETSPLEFAMNNQHMNGGIEVDVWGQTSLAGCHAVGEVSGTHGVTRPGGAALNAGQVFAVRTAQYISKAGGMIIPDEFNALASTVIDDINDVIQQALSSEDGITLRDVKEEIQNRMSDFAGFVCSGETVSRARTEAECLTRKVMSGGITINHVAEISELFMWRHLTLTSSAVLTMLENYIQEGGGSRGARIILDRNGECVPETRTGKYEEWRFRPEREEDKNFKFTVIYKDSGFVLKKKPLRTMPDISKIYFEKNWPDFLTGKIFSN
ncbi:FAD-binding protein [Citrobacter freundii]|uniref:FAD-binding protein n=1 Tax=Citrobacter freundii TaxID=546 RepID=UPI0024E111FA|nr:FAD-binding protein [Citrobacter freundii]EKV5092613.1 FAD-binding protein [Citrobacter freundii]ELN4556636.1 FAD-binding protein [Citrobacter freundii]MDT7261825.1 FAD-binding protein [Citrobacter freundii]WOR59845.1 FAD-binding protein [Citrobacter freundii]HBM8272632.1 FAD-binding protein [Citrobacter freundii]